MRVADYIVSLQAQEARLARVLEALSAGHSAEPDVRATGQLLASWSRQHAQALSTLNARYPPAETPQPVQPPAMPLQVPRQGDHALLLDLHEAWLLAQEVHLRWTVLGQAARALRDGQLAALCAELGVDTDRQLAWLHTRIVAAAPQALIAAP